MAVAKAGYFDLAQSDLSLFGRRGRKIVSFDRLLFSVSGNTEVQIDRQVADIAFGSPATVIWLRIQPKGYPPTTRRVFQDSALMRSFNRQIAK